MGSYGMSQIQQRDLSSFMFTGLPFNDHVEGQFAVSTVVHPTCERGRCVPHVSDTNYRWIESDVNRSIRQVTDPHVLLLLSVMIHAVNVR